MAAYLGLLGLLLAASASAQMIGPVNGSIGALSNSALKLILDSPSSLMTVDVLPLTPQAGLGVPPSSNQNRRGSLVLVSQDSIPAISRMSIAYLDCEASSYSGSVQPQNAFTNTVAEGPQAIVLFSSISDHCNFSTSGKNNFDYTGIYTMLRANMSQIIRNMTARNVPITATISNPRATGNATSDSYSSPTGDPFGPRPTTQIAMIILYSITGLITALFLVIIASGAIRAHRHPERYGPRADMLGRPRQSRAKGIARAMLETLPIVKFGEQQDTKPATDVELATKKDPEPPKAGVKEVVSKDQRSLEQPDAVPSDKASALDAEGSSSTTAKKDEPTASTSETDPIVAAGASTALPKGPDEPSDENPGCSICTEDFVKGEDIRVLPCDHKYHPACVDPWLLNVSGTCPLCRIDLRPSGKSHPPSDSNDLAPPLAANDHSTLPASASPQPSRHRLSRLIELRRMPAEERLEALRTMRAEQRRLSTAPPPVPTLPEAGPSAVGPEASGPASQTSAEDAERRRGEGTERRGSRAFNRMLETVHGVRTRAFGGR
ncbi:MAG: hypothetical protein M1814_002115 [Vezdaea aestivalis]|nr:MAG: hypothetical protein M1814_002115 [Vezdaea aestivalis]